MQKNEVARKAYWRKNLSLLGILLGVWAFISLGCGVLWVDFLDQFFLPFSRIKLGFWFAQQGSIIGFVILVAVYVKKMNKLDLELELSEQEEGEK